MVEQSLGSRYVLGDVLGRGAMGQVFRATVRDTNETVAVKVLRPELADDPEIVARFVQERGILCGLSDPNLVAVRDLVVEGQTLAIVMDFAEGTDLRVCLREHTTLPPQVVCRVLTQIAAGLATVHAAGIVHRDVKPENVLVDLADEEAPVVRLTDFGIARVAHGPSLTRLTGLIGTPEYLAPEVAERNSATPAADIYSTGILAYELLAGRTPFSGGHPVAVLRRHLEDPPMAIPDCPPGLWDLIVTMLDKDPARRPIDEDVERTAQALIPSLAGIAALPRLVRHDESPDPDAVETSTPRRRSELSHAAPVATAIEVVGGSPDDCTPTHLGTLRRRDSVDPEPAARRRSTKMTMLVASIPAVLVAAVFGVVVGGTAHTRTPSAPVHVSIDAYPNGLVVARTWDLMPTRKLLHASLRITNSKNQAVVANVDEVVPKSAAADVNLIAFHPAPDKVVQPDPIVTFHISLAPNRTTTLMYDIPEPRGPFTQSRLDVLAANQTTAENAYHAATGQQTLTLTKLSVTPGSVQLSVGQSESVRINGVMSDGSEAPATVLSQLAWTTTDASVVTVSKAVLTAVGVGSATITAQDGAVTATMTATVLASGQLATQATTFNIGSPPLAPSPAANVIPGTTPNPGSRSPRTTVNRSAPPTTRSAPPPTRPTSTIPPTTTTLKAALIGDINGDGAVDCADKAIMAAHWQQDYPPADLNHDGIVNVYDLSIMAAHWTGPAAC